MQKMLPKESAAPGASLMILAAAAVMSAAALMTFAAGVVMMTAALMAVPLCVVGALCLRIIDQTPFRQRLCGGIRTA